jgi:hypothetical protein
MWFQMSLLKGGKGLFSGKSSHIRAQGAAMRMNVYDPGLMLLILE